MRLLKNGGDLQRTPGQHSTEILALFVIAVLWSQPIYPTAEEQIKKMGYIIYTKWNSFSHKEQ